MKEFRLNSIFVRFFLYIMALVLLSIGLVSFFSYRKSSGMMISEVQNSNMLVLKQAQKGIDQEIKSLQSNIMQAAINRSLNEVVYLAEQKNYDDFALIRDSIAYLSTLKSTVSLTMSIKKIRHCRIISKRTDRCCRINLSMISLTVR